MASSRLILQTITDVFKGEFGPENVSNIYYTLEQVSNLSHEKFPWFNIGVGPYTGALSMSGETEMLAYTPVRLTGYVMEVRARRQTWGGSGEGLQLQLADLMDNIRISLKKSAKALQAHCFWIERIALVPYADDLRYPLGWIVGDLSIVTGDRVTGQGT